MVSLCERLLAHRLAFATLLLFALGCSSRAGALPDAEKASRARNVIIFVADGLRRGSVNAEDAPTFLKVRQEGVDFANSHSLFPTLTTPNASAIAVGHYLGDSGDFGNAEFLRFPIFDDGRLREQHRGSPEPFLENDLVLADVTARFGAQGYLHEDTFLRLAHRKGYNTAAIGKLGPTAIQDVTQLKPRGGAIPIGETVIIDDATGTAAGVPLSPAVALALKAAGLPLVATSRDQSAGDVRKPGTLHANLGQQQYFLNATLKAVLPMFKASGRPFALIYWSRDPDGSQHNQGDSLNQLRPGINGPTSRAGVRNADQNLAAILDYIFADSTLAGNTDLLVTSDHGFATISKHELDAHGAVSRSYSTGFTYLHENNDASTPEVMAGWLPPGFLAIDIAHELAMPLFDPDLQAAGNEGSRYMPVDPAKPNSATARQRPIFGNGLIGGSGALLAKTDAKVIVAANGGADLIYVPSHDGVLIQRLVQWLGTQDYVGGLFVDSKFGTLPGALPLKAVGLEGAALTPRPSIIVSFKTFASDPAEPLQSAIQIADTTLQEGQGMHGSLGRDNTFNNMAAVGPDFKKGFVDSAPVSNADLVQTLISILNLPDRQQGNLTGRVIRESLVGGPDQIAAQSQHIASSLTQSGHATLLQYQTAEGRSYFDAACFLMPATANAWADSPCPQ